METGFKSFTIDDNFRDKFNILFKGVNKWYFVKNNRAQKDFKLIIQKRKKSSLSTKNHKMFSQKRQQGVLIEGHRTEGLSMEELKVFS